METLSPDQWRALFAESNHSALHLEMRDIYAVEDEKQRVTHFQATGSRDLSAEVQALERSWWLDRWLPRTNAARLALPGADFWLDQRRVLFNHFTADGGWLGNELVTDDGSSRDCARTPSRPSGNWRLRTASTTLPRPCPRTSSRHDKHSRRDCAT